jgi:pyruvate-formate lyase-activating enzyme
MDLQNILLDRRAMANGQRPDSCQFCRDHEDKGLHSFRTSIPYLPEQNLDPEAHAPFMVEFVGSNTCHMKCIYCHPRNSSKWAADDPHSPALPKPEITAEMVAQLEKWWAATGRYNFLGGEPAMMPETFRLVDVLADLARRLPPFQFTKTFSVISNLAVSPEMFRKFLDKLEDLVPLYIVDVTFSIESLDRQFDYIRDGGSYGVFMENLEQLLARRHFAVSWISTNNLLSIGNFHLCLEKILGRFAATGRMVHPIYNEVHYPSLLSPRLYPLPLEGERAAARKLLSEFPRELLHLPRLFDDFVVSVDKLYESAGTSSSISASLKFLDEAEPRRLVKMNWRDVFPALAGYSDKSF